MRILEFGSEVKLTAEGRRYVSRFMDEGQELPPENSTFVVVQHGRIMLPVSTNGSYTWFLLPSEAIAL